MLMMMKNDGPWLIVDDSDHDYLMILMIDDDDDVGNYGCFDYCLIFSLGRSF